MDTDGKSLLVAAIVWGLFIAAGMLGRPVKMSAIISVGGGFVSACITAILAKIYFDSGALGLVALAAVIYIFWGVLERLFGRV